jgi:hypothetical protein
MSGSWQTWQSVLSIIGAVGGLCGLWSLWYARRQTHLMERQIHKQETQEKEDLDWSERFERLANQLSRINPSLAIQEPGKSYTIALYASIFPNAQLRDALEHYVVQANPSRTEFAQRHAHPDELRRSNLRETVKRAEQYMAAFQKQHPQIDLKYYMG